LQKPQEQANHLSPPRSLILDFTTTHPRFWRSILHPTGQLTHTKRSDGTPETDGALQTVDRGKILRYRQIYLNRPDPIVFIPVSVDTSGHIYDDFSRLLFWHSHREPSVLANELPEGSDQCRFLRSACLNNLEESVGLILAKASLMRISIPFDFSSRSFRRPIPLLTPSLVLFLHVLSKRNILGVHFNDVCVFLLIIVLA
jgi:hypothetical protein